MTDFEVMRSEIQSLGPIINNAKKYFKKKKQQLKILLKQAQIYANRSYIYGYQLRLIIGSLEMDLSGKVDDDDDDLHMPLVHRAIHRLRDFFFVGKQPSLEVVVEIDSDSHYQCEMKDMYAWYYM